MQIRGSITSRKVPSLTFSTACRPLRHSTMMRATSRNLATCRKIHSVPFRRDAGQKKMLSKFKSDHFPGSSENAHTVLLERLKYDLNIINKF